MSNDIKAGDRFEITVEVMAIQGGGFWCRPLGAPTDDRNNIAESALLSGRRLPRAIKVGDRVTWGARLLTFEVLCIHGERAWLGNAVRVDTKEPASRTWFDTQHLSDLTLIPGDET